jgi:hypothetical protein
MTTPSALRRDITAYINGAEREDQPENIHTDKVAREMGYKGALVYGTVVYAWSVPLIREALGDEWMRSGWADIHIRRPVYSGDDLTITLEPGEGDAYQLAATDPEGKARITAALGNGTGEWVADHRRSRRLTVEPLPNPRPRITLETAPIGQDLPRLQAEAHDRLGKLFQEATEHGYGPLTVGGREVQSPATVTGRMTWYVHAVWDYAGPAIHSRSQVQYLDFVGVDEPVSVAGHFVDAYEMNGHHYSITDGTVFGADGREVALTRHSSIFKVAPR